MLIILTQTSPIPSSIASLHHTHFIHSIQFSPLWYSKKREVKGRNSASRPSQSSIEPPATGTTCSVSKFDGQSNTAEARWTLIFLFLKDQRKPSTHPLWLSIQWPVVFSYSEFPQQHLCRVNSFFLCCATTRIWLLSGLTKGWYLMLWQAPQKWRATSVFYAARRKSCGIKMLTT